MMKTIKLFFKDSCVACPQAKKVVEDFCKEQEEVKLELYDIETVDGLAESAYYEVYGCPTALIFKDDVEVKRIIGNVREEDLI